MKAWLMAYFMEAYRSMCEERQWRQRPTSGVWRLSVCVTVNSIAMAEVLQADVVFFDYRILLIPVHALPLLLLFLYIAF
jgi:hypothetical protein